MPLTAQAFPPQTLAEALTRSTDREHQRIPLLALNAENVFITFDNTDGREKLDKLYGISDDSPVPPRSEVIGAFQRQIISCTTLQVIAPIHRIKLNPFPGPPTDWAQIGRDRAARLLFGSLTPAQWEIASGGNGLGLGDLTSNTQKAWFRGLLPEPFQIKEVVAADSPGSYSQTPDARITIVEPEQVRLRVSRSMSWMYGMKNVDSAFWGTGTTLYTGHKQGEPFWILHPPPDVPKSPDSYSDKIKEAVRIEEPNRLRKSDLSFNTAPLYGKNISLKDAKTLGDLVLRVAQKTGVEIYADRRIAGMKVTVFGPGDGEVDAADLMKAFCFAVAGAIRAVKDVATGESVYILTSDQEGLTRDRLRLAEWASDVESLVNSEQINFYNTVKKGKYASGIPFASDSPTISTAAMRAAEEQLADPDYGRKNSGHIKISVTELSPSGRERVKRDLEQLDLQQQGQSPLDKDNVYASFSVTVTLQVAGYGEFSGPGIGNLSDYLVTKPVPPRVRPTVPAGPIYLPRSLAPFVGLKIAPQKTEEVEQAARWAQSHGVNALLIATSLWSKEPEESWEAFVAIGKRYGIRVYPSVSVLRADSIDESVSKKDMGQKLVPATNIFAETLREYAHRRESSPAVAGDRSYATKIEDLHRGLWLDASSAKNRTVIGERLGKVARLPGIAGLFLDNVAAPGMATRNGYWNNGSQEGLYSGYADSSRVAFIRQENMDPIDITMVGGMPPYSVFPGEGWIPFFSMENGTNMFKQTPVSRKDSKTGNWIQEIPQYPGDIEEPMSAWKAFRATKNREYMAQLRQEAHLPASVPVWVQAPTELGNLPIWTSPWSETEALLPEAMGKTPLLTLTLRSESTPESVRMGLGPQLIARLGASKTLLYTGILLDTTRRPLEEVLSLLSPLKGIEK